MNPTLEQIWTEFAEPLRSFIRQRVPDATVTDDIVQDVFLKLSRQLEQNGDAPQIRGWLYRVARNAIIDHYRTRKETVQLPEDLAAQDEFALDELEELKAAFRAMIHSLPGPYREAILLTELDGVSQVELARRLGLSISGAKSRVQRGREQLKQMLLDRCHFQFDRLGRVYDCRPRHRGSCPECASTAA